MLQVSTLSYCTRTVVPLSSCLLGESGCEETEDGEGGRGREAQTRGPGPYNRLGESSEYPLEIPYGRR